jgi:regulator of protease activity HflC (stomatin/prohibitin superfamily)
MHFGMTRSPRPVRNAVRLMCAGAALTLADAMTVPVTLASVRSAAVHDVTFTGGRWHTFLLTLVVPMAGRRSDRFAVAQVAQTSLRAVTGRSDMDQLLAEREKVNAELKDVIDEPTEQPWGIRVERVEVRDVALPEAMKRSMSRQAEAERERRARIIGADGEYQAAGKLAQAASVMAADPAALQLRLLQTVVEVAAEKNSRVVVVPVPVELLRFLGRAASAAGRRPGSGHI